MYHGYNYFGLSFLFFTLLIDGMDSSTVNKHACLRSIAVQCPSFWGLVRPSLDVSGLARIAVVAGMPGVLSSCPAFHCLDRFVTPRDKCITQAFLDDLRHSKLTPAAPIEDYTNLAHDMFNNAVDKCDREFGNK